MQITSYPRENIALWEGPMLWAVRWARPECGCLMMCGFLPGRQKPGEDINIKEDTYWAMKSCDDHEDEITVVLDTMKTMPPSDEEIGALFTRLLEEQIA